MKQLIDAGLLAIGTLLTPSPGDRDTLAEVLPDGSIQFDEELYDSPSGAGRADQGRATNEWTFWIADTADGQRSLAALPEALLGEEHNRE